MNRPRLRPVLFAIIVLLMIAPACKFIQQTVNPAAPTFPAVFTLAPQPTHTRAPTATFAAFPTYPPTPEGTAAANLTPTAAATDTGATPTAAAHLAPPNSRGPGVIYAQDFAAPAEDWESGTSEDKYLHVARDFDGGAYRWRLQAKRGFFTMQRSTAVANLPEPFYHYTAMVAAPEAPDALAFGLVFNVQRSDDFYYFKVTTDGTFALFLRSGDEFETLIDETETEAVQRGSRAANRLSVVLRGDLIELYINGQLQASHVDTTLRGGGIGLAVELYAGEEALVLFDDIIVCDARCEAR